MKTIVLYILAFFCLFILGLEKVSAQKKPVPKTKKTKTGGLGITARPLLSYNDDLGFLYGANIGASYYQKNYEPYRYKFWAEHVNSSLSYKESAAYFDYMSLSGLRWRANLGRKENPFAKYYGYGNYQDIRRIRRITGEQSPVLALGPNILRTLTDVDPEFDRERVKDSQNRYYDYSFAKSYMSASIEKRLEQSNFKYLLGCLSNRYRIHSYYNEREANELEPNILGYIDIEQPIGYDAVREGKSKTITYLRMALAYDTRPLKSKNNPSAGIFADIHYENASELLGSDYTYSNLTLTWRQYVNLFPELLSRTLGIQSVFVYRLMLRETLGGTAPFFEAGKMRSIAETVEGLGGLGGLRGFPANQFIDKFISIANFELRHTFLKSDIWGGMDFQFLHFYDIGRVSSSSGEWEAKDFHKAYGLGAAVVWQTNLVAQLFFGFSEFHRYRALSLQHTF